MNERNNNAVKILLGIAIVVILAIVFILVYKNFGPSQKSSQNNGTASQTEASEATEATANDTEADASDDTADVTEPEESENTEAAGAEADASDDAALITITIEVIDNEEQSVEYVVETDAEYLRQAMEESDMEFSGTESSYGMMVETVNGLTADYNTDGAYWAFYVDGEYCNYGIDSQPIADGEHYQIIYTAGM